MPFDGVDGGSNARLVLAFEKLDEVQRLIGSKDRWCQRSFYYDGRRCLVSAMVHVTEGDIATLEPIVLRAIEDITGITFGSKPALDRYWIERFNDNQTTTHATVMQVLDHAKKQFSMI